MTTATVHLPYGLPFRPVQGDPSRPAEQVDGLPLPFSLDLPDDVALAPAVAVVGSAFGVWRTRQHAQMPGAWSSPPPGVHVQPTGTPREVLVTTDAGQVLLTW